MQQSNEDHDVLEEAHSNLDIKYPMLPFEKQIFVDVFDKDALVIMAK